MINQGTINLSGSGNEAFGPGLFDNAGTIIESGGQFSLDPDTTLLNEAGGVYNLEVDATLGVSASGGGANPVLVNAGTFKKSAGNSSTTMAWDLDNTGTFQVDAGTLTQSGNVVEAANGALTGGTWVVSGGASLSLSQPGKFTTNQADVTLSGAGSTFTNFSSLNSNAGTLAITSGASLSAPAGLTNTGTLELGSASTVAITGSFTQTSAGTLDVQLSGAPASGQFGKLTATGAGALAGTLLANLAGTYSPSPGDSFKVLSEASESGSFTSFNLPGTAAAFFQASVSSTGATVTAVATQTNLAPVSIDSSLPATLTVGQNLSVTFTVKNQGIATTPVSSWVDSVYLSPSTSLGSSAVLLGQVTHSGALAAGGTYQETVSDPLPAIPPGQYFVIVQADSGGVVPDSNRGNNSLASSAAIPVAVTSLALGTPASGTIKSGQDLYFEINPPAGQDVTVMASSTVAGFAAVFESAGNLPDTTTFDNSASIAGQATQTVEFFAPQAEAYFVLVQGTSAAGTGTSFTITAQPAALSLTALGASSGSDAGQVTVPIFGTFFQTGLQASLVDSSHVSHGALAVLITSSTQAYATFDLSQLATGTYSVQVRVAGGSATLPSAFSVVAGTAGQFQAQLSFPNGTSTGAGPVEGVITYSNTGGTDLIAPLLVLDGNGQAGLRLDASEPFSTDPLLLLAASSSGPAGVLRPGEQGQITFQALPSAASDMTLDVTLSDELSTSTAAIDYPSLEAQVEPAGTTAAEFGPVFQQFENEGGPTYGGLVMLMAQTATEIGVQGSGQGNGSIYSGQDIFAKIIRDASAKVNGAITGQLFLNDNSNPLANATLSIVSSDQTIGDSAVTFDDGSFAFPAMPPGTYSLSVSGYLVTAPLQVVVPTAGSVSGLDVTVSTGAIIAGTVDHSGTNAPLGSVTVTAISDQDESFTTTTADDGSYQLAGLPAGTYTVTASGADFDSQTQSGIALANNQSQGGVNFTLDDAATLDGTVLASTTGGAPIAGATILLVDSNSVNFSATTNTTGAYSIANLHPGTYNVTVTAAGFATGQSTVTLAAGSTVTAPLTLAPGASVTVTVTTAASAPVSSADVQITQNGAYITSADTDSTGRITLSGLSAGTFQLEVDADGFLSATDSFTLSAGQTLARSYSLGSAGQITGVVTDGAGNPLANVPLFLLEQNGSQQVATTGADGSYDFDTLALDTYDLSVGQAPGIDRQQVVVSASNLVQTVNFSLSGANVSGTVVASDGATPVAGALVALEQGNVIIVTTETDSTGAYELEAVAPGTYTIATGGPTGLAPPQAITVGSSDLTVPTLQLGTAQLSGSVVDPSNDPVSGANVLLVPGPLALAQLGLTASTDANGDFTLSSLVPGSYSLFVDAPGFPAQAEQVTVTANGAPISIKLPAGTTLSGTITDATTDQGISGATVDLFSVTSKLDVATIVADSNGSYQESNVPPGTYDLLFADPQGAHALKELTNVVLGAAPLVENAQLAATSTTLQGTVTDTKGQPVAGASVLFFDAQGNLITVASTATNGNYAVTVLPAGTYGVEIESTGYLPSATTNVTVPSSGTVAGPTFSLSPSGVDAINPFDALFNGVNAISGSIGKSQLDLFNPAGQPTPSDEHALAKPFLDILENDPNVCVAELDAGIALDTRLSTLSLARINDQWASDYNDLILIEGKGINIMLRDIALLGLALTPAVGQAKQVAGTAQLSVEAANFASAAASSTATLLDSLSRLAGSFVAGNPPTNFKTMIIGDLNTYISSLATAAGLKDGSFASVPFIKQFVSSHPGLFKFLGPFTSIVNLATNIVSDGQSIVSQETQVLNDKTTYLNAISDTSVKLQALVKAIADCRDQKSNNQASTPVPTSPQPVAWSHTTLPNVIFVTSNGDSGSGTLRAAIVLANGSSATGPVEIDFSELTNPRIMLQSPLPNILHPIYLYGMTGPTCTMLVIDGSKVANGAQQDLGDAFNLVANNSTIRDVDFVNFAGNPVLISGNNDTIDDSYFGVDSTGEAAAPIGGAGIVVTGSSDMIGSPIPGNGDIVSNTGLTGIVIAGNGDQVVGNLIGLDKAGTKAMADGAKDSSGDNGSGIAILTAGNTIGGTISIERNVIAASAQQGIVVGGTITFTAPRGLVGFETFGGTGAANNNVIEGNYVGTDATGENALGNGQDGILIGLGATGNTIGGTDGTDPSSGITGAGNLISGNGLSGVEISSTGSTGNVVLGNYIGVDALGTKPMGNKDDGIAIDPGTTANTVGGSSSGATNIISANAQNGIALNPGTSANAVLGNWIGTDRTGTVSFVSATVNFGNGGAGIAILSSSNNTIGGADVATPTLASAGAGNLISGNAEGIVISQPNSTISTANLVLGNYIGTDVSGRRPLPNQNEGILISSDSNTIGGTTPATRNIISGNVGDGITLTQSATIAGAPPHAPVMNLIEDDFIGTDASGKNTLGNTSNGITITGGSNNTIGGPATSQSNLISANGAQGIQIFGTSSAPATTNVISGNIIGTDFTSSIALGNFSDGIGIVNASGNMIGGLAAGSSVGNPPGNAIAGNGGNGIFIQGALATGNTVSGNVIGLGARIKGQPNPLPNSGSGIQIDSASGNQLGGTTAGAANVIAGNTGNGIGISDTQGTGVVGNLLQGNFIGVTDDLLAAGNGAAGVSIQGARSNVIGGSSAAARNVIAGNTGNGVELLNSASGNQVLGNWIGYTGTAVSGNLSDGVFVSDSGNNTIGGITAGSGNVISGNSLNGIELRADPTNPANSAGNQLIGNFIGTNDKGTATSITTSSSTGPVTTLLGNLEDGVLVEGVPGLTIGMPLAGGPGPINLGGNLISGNLASGIQLVGQGSSPITIQANFIGTDVSGTLALANSKDGIFIVDTLEPTSSSASSSFGPTSVSIGGSVPGTGNLISGNAGNGIEITGRGQTDDAIQGNMIGTNLAGTASLGNSGSGVLLEGVSANTIGGTTGTNPGTGIHGASNLISGNLANGIAFATVADSLGTAVPEGNVVQGNLIGTDITGQKPIGNGTVTASNVTGSGIFLDGATNTTIGGTNAAARNLISANRGGGVAIENESSRTLVEGNYIGTDSTGSFTDPEGNLTDADELSNDIQLGSGSSASNFGGGILIIDSPNNVVGSPSGLSPGGALSGGGNLIAGILEPGIEIEGSGSRHNLVQSNYIGTNVSGTKALVTPVNNVQTGAATASSSSTQPLNQIGGTTAAERNLISGNLESGVALLGLQSTGNVVEGNFIGSDVTGTKPIPNAQAGVLIGGAVDNLIGGESSVTSGTKASGAANLISSGGTAGVLLETFTIAGSLSTPTGNQIEGNLIGTDVTGSNALSNAQQTGIEISAGVGANTIGGTTAAAGNVIAFSSGSGISLDGTASGTAVSNTPQQVTILSNSIFSNASAGINFKRNSGLTGTLPNQGEPGPELSDFVFTDTGGLEIDGTLESLPNTTFHACNSSATPVAQQSSTSLQGETLLNTTPVSVTTDASGEATFAATDLTVVAGDVVYTATATDSSGNTSDFGVQTVVPPPQPPSGATVDLKLTGTALPNPVAQAGRLTYQLTVTNNGPYQATGVLFSDNLPAGVTFVSATPSQGSVTGTSSVSWLLDSLLLRPAGDACPHRENLLDRHLERHCLGDLAARPQLIPGDNQVTRSARSPAPRRTFLLSRSQSARLPRPLTTK